MVEDSTFQASIESQERIGFHHGELRTGTVIEPRWPDESDWEDLTVWNLKDPFILMVFQFDDSESLRIRNGWKSPNINF